MIVVVDANELFSLLIRGSKDSAEILFSNEVELIAPEFIFLEFSNNKEEILEKTHRNEEEFLEVLLIIKNKIKLIPEQEFEEFLDESRNLFPQHTKDVPYLALALKYKCPVWSEEKLLKKQDKIEILNTQELIKRLREI
ncbi:MAG: PIN domain-containing protein [Nanoarchaeota archaeon]